MIDDDILHGIVREAAEQVRQRLSDANIGNRFKVEIALSGELNSSAPLLVSYRVSDSVWGGGPEANRLSPSVTELLRRKGWEAAHAPLALPPSDIEVPPPAPTPLST